MSDKRYFNHMLAAYTRAARQEYLLVSAAEEGRRVARELHERLGVELYQRVLRQANRVLHHCQHYSIEILALENPTYVEVAAQMAKVADIIRVLSDDFDPMMSGKALEYVELIRQIGAAVQNRDEVQLSKLTEELARKPGT